MAKEGQVDNVAREISKRTRRYADAAEFKFRCFWTDWVEVGDQNVRLVQVEEERKLWSTFYHPTSSSPVENPTCPHSRRIKPFVSGRKASTRLSGSGSLRKRAPSGSFSPRRSLGSFRSREGLGRPKGQKGRAVDGLDGEKSPSLRRESVFDF